MSIEALLVGRPEHIVEMYKIIGTMNPLYWDLIFRRKLEDINSLIFLISCQNLHLKTRMRSVDSNSTIRWKFLHLANFLKPVIPEHMTMHQNFQFLLMEISLAKSTGKHK